MIVFDSSTLILITKIELLDTVLNTLPIKVAIPMAVADECCGGTNTLDALLIRKAIDESRIAVKRVRNRKLVAKLEEDFRMGRGESEAITLAMQENATLIAIDDKRGINACKLVGISFTTAIALLLRSRQKGLIDRDDALGRLAKLGRYGRYKASILQDAKLRLEEQP
jgi:predicted nucleic acid-binding protein